MNSSKFFSYHIFPCLLLLLLGITISSSSVDLENEDLINTYIIHMDHSQKPTTFTTHESWHWSILSSLSNPVNDKQMLLYSYNHAIHGFSARLTQSQLYEIEKSPAYLATFQESFGKLFTTYSPEFLGLNNNHGLWPTSSYGEGVIIGILDTGIWPESESFNDRGMPPVPKRWKGKCENGTTFSPSLCNKKLIGARFFNKGLKVIKGYDSDSDSNSARDFDGHGTHTSSTAAGSHVIGVSHFGYARGIAKGVAPAAHVAMYKVLFATDSGETAATDVLAGMDQAIADGVDIMSLSLGFDQQPYFNDLIAIASLSAIEKGILVVCAAGNDGGHNSTYNGAPWITTVGAGTFDRSFTATVTLGNGLEFQGTSYFPESIYITDAPLYYGKTNSSKAICDNGAFSGDEVHGKIVLCDNTTRIDVEGQKEVLEEAGAYAGIFMTDMSLLDPEDYTIPMIVLPTASGALIREYASGAIRPKVRSMRFVTTSFGTKPAPEVADFSSRGPDPINPTVLKPDILAPGVDILAAIAPYKTFMEIGKYHWVSDYALYSGTSMAAPHVAGVAALLKNVHPNWSPAAIRSAIMTTTYTIDNTGTTLKNQFRSIPTTPLDFGAGHIDPNKSMDPGLIYDMSLQDYINFLCSLGYTKTQMKVLLRRNQWDCSQRSNDLNYPSFMVIYTNSTSSSREKTFSRIVTNVGDGAAVYQATLEIPQGMRVTVKPDIISFTPKYHKQQFYLSVEIDIEAPPVIYGYLKWIDQHMHVVSSPIVAIRH